MEEQPVADFFPETAAGVATAGFCAFCAALGSLYQVRKLPLPYTSCEECSRLQLRLITTALVQHP